MASHRNDAQEAFDHRETSESNALSEAEGERSRRALVSCPNQGPYVNKTDGSCFIYILRCADGAYYVGSTTALAARLDTHNAGRGPRFTASRRPVTLLYSEPFPTLAQARKREIQIKKWSRAKKQALIAGDIQKLHEMSRRRTG